MKKIKVLVLMFIISLPSVTNALEYPQVNSKIVEVYDMTDDKVLYEVDSNKVSSLASLTKIATTITAIENINNLDEQVIITNSILNTVDSEASVAGLRVGDKLTYRDLLYASMLPSGADATNSIAILSSGSISNFVDKMNELVNRIGLHNTHFVNVTGLDVSNHYSTADDVRKLLVYSLKNPLFKEIYSAKQYTLSNGLTVKSTLIGRYKSNIDTSKIIGSKTGFTLDAGYCLSSVSTINNHDMIIIVLKANNSGINYYNVIDTLKLLEFVETNYKEAILVKKGQLIKQIPVDLSNIDNYKILATNDITKYLPIDYDKQKIKIDYKGLTKLSFKNKKGEKLGTINYYYDNELVFKENAILNKNIKIDFIKVIKKYYYIVIGISLIALLIIIKIIKKIRCK